MKEQVLICKPFNLVYLGFFAVFAILFAVGVIVLRKKEEKTRAVVLALAMLITLVGFFVYKLFLSRDEAFSQITDAAGIGGFNWWGELPVQLCNINMILIPIAALTRKRSLLCFCFFMGPLGAAFALALPSAGFECYSILLPRMIGFYGTHWMVFFGSIALGALGLYKPSYKDLIRTVVSALVIAFVVFLFDVVLRRSGLNRHANYFFAMETEGNPILNLFHSWLPYPFLFLLPSVLILAPYVGIVVTVANGIQKLGQRKKAKNIAE